MTFWDTFVPGTTFVTTEEKQELAESGRTFLICGVYEANTQFGEQWMFEITDEFMFNQDGKMVPDNDTLRTMSFSKNAMRNQFAKAVKQHIAQTSEPVPCRLSTVRAANGLDAFTFERADD